MDTVIGLGKAGCAIADEFSKFDQYKILKIDVGLEGLKKDGIYNMPKQSGPEMYEEKCPNMRNFFKEVKGEILFVIGGSGDITGATLRILQSLSNCNINVLYVRPDVKFLPEMKKKHEWATFNILQEYARSAVFKRLWLVDNICVEKLIGEVPIKSYYETINQFIVSTIHMVNVYNHIEPVASTFSEPYKTHRISTFGLSGIGEEKINLLFPLDNMKEMRYYYAINNQRIEDDGKLFTKIKKQVKTQATDEIKTSFGVYSTDYDSDYVYVVCNTPVIQRQVSNEEAPLDLFA